MSELNHEITRYVSDIGNGDPIIVYSPETQALTLGTGFHSFDDVRREIERVVDVSDGQKFDVFGIDGHIEFDSRGELNE